MDDIIYIAGIIGGAISFFTLVYRIADGIRKIENIQDRRHAVLADRLASLEGRLTSYDALLSGWVLLGKDG